MSPMAASPAAALSISFLLLLSAAEAPNVIKIDINKILVPYPDFSDFNKLLSETGVANEINQQPSCTVLVVDNAHMSELSSQLPNTVKNTLSLHVVLDYYDEAKLKKVDSKKPLLLTTLYEISGKPPNQQGFLRLKDESNGEVAFGSAAPGSKLDTTFVKQITTLPDRVSVLQVSNIIHPSNSASPAPLPVASSPRKVLAPAEGTILKKSPSPAPAPAPAPATSDGFVGYGDYIGFTILMVSLGFGFFLL